MERLGFQAATLGEREFLHGLGFLLETVRAHPDLFVSANVMDAATGKPLVQPSVVRAYPVLHSRPAGRDRLRVAITGYLDPSLQPELRRCLGPDSDKVHVADPLPALKDLVARLRQQADVVVVLAHARMKSAVDVATAVSGIDLMVVGHVTGVFERKTRVNGTALVLNNDAGKSAAQAAITLEATGRARAVTRQVPLNEELPEHPGLVPLQSASAPASGASSAASSP